MQLTFEYNFHALSLFSILSFFFLIICQVKSLKEIIELLDREILSVVTPKSLI